MEVKKTAEGFTSGTTKYYRLEVAASLTEPPLHPQSLQRLYRQSGPTEEERKGLKLGRSVYFNAKQLADLGYSIEGETAHA